MGRPKKIRDIFSISQTALEGESQPTPAPAEPQLPPPPPEPPPYAGPQFEYKVFAGPGVRPANYLNNFEALGAEGWQFVGVDCYNQNVFQRIKG